MIEIFYFEIDDIHADIKLKPKIDKYDNRSAHSREGNKVMGCVQPGMHISLCRKEGANGTGICKYDTNLLRSGWGFMLHPYENVTYRSTVVMYMSKRIKGEHEEKST